jgi:hypothetical protein
MIEKITDTEKGTPAVRKVMIRSINNSISSVEKSAPRLMNSVRLRT